MKIFLNTTDLKNPTIEITETFDKYKQNLKRVGRDIYSYDTLVARINRGETHLTQLGWWSVTTQKHINYVASELNLKLIK